MAVEAATQFSEIKGIAANSIFAFDFHNVNISTALIIPDNESGVEMLLGLHPTVLNNRAYYASRFEFQITSVSKVGDRDVFTEHVRGQVHLNLDNQGLFIIHLL